MSYFDDASLVMIPRGYKPSTVFAVKPTDGTGDLTFTRSNDTATRVGPDGLIEKVRTNVALYSEQFDNAYWGKSNVTVTANTTVNPVNGATTADTLTRTGGVSGFLNKQIAQTGIVTLSIFAKAGTTNEVRLNIFDGSTDRGATYNLTTGAISSVYGSPIFTTAQSFGNGWYRISISVNSASYTDCQVQIDSVNSVIIFGAQLETGDIATPYIGPTLGSAVSVGPVANVPRLDYLNSSCPRLLLEPQRTNSQINSENFAAWLGIDNVTIGSNTTDTLDPAGYNGADKITIGSGSPKRIYEFTGSSAGTGTISLFVKAGTSPYIALFTSSSSLYVQFNLSTQVITPTTGTGTITSYGNGWYRVTATATLGSNEVLQILFDNAPSQTIYIWGAQVEAGAYATSYIPTLGAAVTRGDELATKTSASALIGQTEGTLFLEFDFVVGEQANYGIIYNAAFSTYIYVNQQVSGSIFGQVQPFDISFSVAKTSGRYKCAIAYKSGSSAFFVNGVQVGTTNTTTFSPSTMDIFSFLNGDNTKGIHQAILFPTRLSNSDLAALTA